LTAVGVPKIDGGLHDVACFEPRHVEEVTEAFKPMAPGQLGQFAAERPYIMSGVAGRFFGFQFIAVFFFHSAGIPILLCPLETTHISLRVYLK